MDRSLWAVLAGTFTLRFSTGLTGAMLGVYLAEPPRPRRPGGRAPIVVGLFGAPFYLAELVLSPVFGVLSDRHGHHRVMLYGPVFGAVAVIMTASPRTWDCRALAVLLAPITGSLVVLGGTRFLEGASTAASVPSILGFIAIVTAGDELLRGKAAARFEGATLLGLGAGFAVAPAAVRGARPDRVLPQRRCVYGVSFLIFLDGQGPGAAKRARPGARRTSGSAATCELARAARTSGCWRRPGSRSTPRSGCGSASRSSSSRRRTRTSPTRP